MSMMLPGTSIRSISATARLQHRLVGAEALQLRGREPLGVDPRVDGSDEHPSAADGVGRQRQLDRAVADLGAVNELAACVEHVRRERMLEVGPLRGGNLERGAPSGTGLRCHEDLRWKRGNAG